MVWKEILPSIVFTLNTSESSATKCAPYKVVYCREPTFPTDIIMDTMPSQITAAIMLLGISLTHVAEENELMHHDLCNYI